MQWLYASINKSVIVGDLETICLGFNLMIIFMSHVDI